MEIPLSVIDLVAIGIILFAIWMGAHSGLAAQALALAGLVAGIVLLIVAAPYAAPLFGAIEPPLGGLVALGVMASVVLIAQSVGSELGAVLRRRMGYGVLGGVDRAAGAVFGIARGVFLVWMLGGLLAVAPLPVLGAEARQSLILRVLDTRLPSPVVLAAEFGRIIQEAGLPDVFVEVPPPAAEPVDGPTQQAADQIAAAARASTLRVEAVACARFQTGTGFAIEPSYFVTNAHVVAGAERAWLSHDGSLERYPVRIVHFDERLDVALLYAPGLEVGPLSLADSVPARGTDAAAIGFTGGGRQRVIPAGVSRSMEALGRDIYGRDVVPRRVIEMQADVAPGDSGGPVLLADGTVGGVTFSESREDPRIGYALSPVAVAEAVGASIGRTDSVSPGNCLPGR